MSKLISIRLEEDVLAWFREHPNYQSLIKKVLREYVLLQIKKTERNIGRAQEIFKQNYIRCFWHLDPALQISEGNFYIVIDGLKKYGGREGYLLADELCQ